MTRLANRLSRTFRMRQYLRNGAGHSVPMIIRQIDRSKWGLAGRPSRGTPRGTLDLRCANLQSGAHSSRIEQQVNAFVAGFGLKYCFVSL